MPPINTADRVTVDGKFFRNGGRKFHIKGVTYGPFAPNAEGEMFPSREQTARDLKMIQKLNANVLRVYYVPPAWLLDLAAQHGVKVLIDVPWPKHLCFLDSRDFQNQARRALRNAVKGCEGHPAVLAYSVVNEIPAEIVRWSGVRRVEKFIDELIDEAKDIDPDCLCTFTSFPPTEFLQPGNIDFVCFNVYLHHQKPLEAYLARLQTLADAKPLVLAEFGMDSIREGEEAKCEFLRWQIESAFRGGVAGAVVFSFTDDWFRGGMQIEDWGFGLTTCERQPKTSFGVVQKQYRCAPYFPLPGEPRVSVVVATYNGGRTLRNCLESLTRLNYRDYEVIVVDDGSTDETSKIAADFPSVKYVRQTNQGLSAARNAGIRAATGEIVAFTDDDCRADEDWLYYLVNDLLRSDFAGIGGHNFLPPEDSPIAAAVVVSPGGPAHVMLTDREAEHIPGCNMAFYKWALGEIGGFDPIFRKAGDDVDVCWRLQDSHLKIGFSPAGFVWHYRRSTVNAYLKQQSGYGEAEALLIGKHPEHFNAFGGGLWRGRIYAASFSGLLLRGAVIYHGIFGSGFFQRLYSASPVQSVLLCTSLAYHAFVNLPLLLLTSYFNVFLPLALATVGLSVGACTAAAIQARLPKSKTRFWSRPLVALLFFLQPVVRDWARFKCRFNLLSNQRRVLARDRAETASSEPLHALAYWSPSHGDRYSLLRSIQGRLEQGAWTYRTDTGWTSYDVEVPAHVWTRLRITTVTQELEQGKKSFRCRIDASWSAPARLLFVAAALTVAALLFTLAHKVPWVWMSLIVLPLILWALEDEKNEHTKHLGALIDEAANEQALVKIESAAG
jgi:glycosyltransferase involved in cell wall biosynthesis